MLIIKVDGKLDRAIKQYKNKYNRVGIRQELSDRQQFTKPSLKKRKAKLKAVYVQKLKNKENE